MIALRNNIKTVSVKVSRYDEVGQSFCKIKIGIIYGP